MSVIGSNILAGASGQGGGYNLERSIRFRRAGAASFFRTPASAGNRKTWTWSGWVKRGQLGISNGLLAANDAAVGGGSFGFNSPDTFYLTLAGVGTQATNAVFRDPSAWYHVVFALDTTQATQANRAKVYINGVQQTFSSNIVGLNADYDFNNTLQQRIGTSGITGSQTYADMYLTEVNFIDGQALTPSSFGETSATTGVWQPKKYAGTYGTNGFYLKFTDNSTTAALGTDFSGNGNNWSDNNFALAAGVDYDSMTDVPTLTSATAANFAVLNPLYNYPAPRLSNANLTTSNNGTAVTGALSTIGVTSGKWYFEATNTTTVNQSTSIGIVDSTFNFNAGAAYIIDGTTYRITGNPTFASYTNGDTIGVAFDAGAGTISFYKNGTLQGTGNYSYLTNGTPVFPYVYIRDDATGSWNANFGQRPFAYTPPTGFVALNTFNLPTPTIGATASTQANKYMDATTYTGNGSTQNIVNSGGFQPDLVWVKSRSSVTNHLLYDVNRGVSNVLLSNSTSSDVNLTTAVTSFNANGFSLGNYTESNTNGSTYVGWQWRASNATLVTNTAGSITSTVSANTSSGFSVVTYTGNGSSGATVGHGLGVAPAMVIIKSRTNGSADWQVFHKMMNNGSNPWNYSMYLNGTSAQFSYTGFNNTAPTSSLFTLGSNGGVNQSSNNFVAYCFSEVAGYSKFGSYTGNYSTDGTFVYLGFRPKYIMIKAVNDPYEWLVVDTSRSPFNFVDDYLKPNDSAAEAANLGSTNALDILSNGFKLRSTWTRQNDTVQYIYMAFAENPFKYSLAR